MRQVPFRNIFSFVMSVELGTNLLLPLLAFIFFANDTPLFSSSTSMAQRSLLFGLCIGLQKLSNAPGNLLITAWSDDAGRKPAMILSLIGLLIVSLLGITALALHSPGLLITGFFLGGCLDTNKSIGPAMIADNIQGHQRVVKMGLMQATLAFGACIGPIIGGQITHYSLGPELRYASPFALAVVISLTALIFIRFFPETITTKTIAIKINFKKILRDYWNLLQIKSVIGLLLLLILCQSSWSCYYEFTPPILKNIFNFSPAKVGLFMGMIALWLVVAAAILLRFLSTYFNSRQLIWMSIVTILIGTIMALIACILSSHPVSQFLLWGSALPTSMGDVIFFSVLISLLTQKVAINQQGKVMGLTLLVTMLVWALIALIGGWLMGIFSQAPFWIAPIGVLILLLSFILIPPKEFLL